jgi:hypothetical protein
LADVAASLATDSAAWSTCSDDIAAGPKTADDALRLAAKLAIDVRDYDRAAEVLLLLRHRGAHE